LLLDASVYRKKIEELQEELQLSAKEICNKSSNSN